MIRYNVREYSHLREISILLKDITNEKIYSEFTGLPRDRPPTEDELQDMILAFDRDIMNSTILMIETYLQRREEYWNEWRVSNGFQPTEKNGRMTGVRNICFLVLMQFSFDSLFLHRNFSS